MEKSSRGNNLPEDFVPDMFDLHEEQQKVHDSAQAGNDQTKNRLPAVEKKQMGSKTRIFSYKDKNFPLQKKEEEKKSKLEHYKLLELGTVESKMKQLNLSGLHQEEIVTSKKLQEYRKQQIARKAKDHLRNKEENGLSGRENNVESVAQETNQAGRALPGLEQMQYLPTQTQAKLSNRRHTTKESDCGSLVQPRQQKFVLTPTEFEDIQREIKEAERQLAQLMRDLKPQQKRKERIIRHTHALQMQQQHQEMHRPGQYVMPEGCAEGQTEDLSHLPSAPKEEATEHPGRATVRRRRQWNRNQPSSQPEGFHSMPPTGQSHSSDFNLHTNSSRPVVKIEANTVILNINDWSSFPKSIDTEI